MGLTISKLFASLLGRREMRILMVGLDLQCGMLADKIKSDHYGATTFKTHKESFLLLIQMTGTESTRPEKNYS